MIDWAASNSTSTTAKNSDYVAVICAKCRGSRQLKYLVAKRSSDHLCMSCCKKQGEHATGDMVIYTCIDCSKKKRQKYRACRFKNWRCHHCAMVKGHKDGKFVVTHNSPSTAGCKKISDNAKQYWQDPEYRKQWQESRAKTKESRSAKSKEIWSDQARLQRLAATIRAIWAKPDYRAAKCRQSRELWENNDYVAKQAEGLADPIVRQQLSASSKASWAEHEYRIKIAQARAGQSGKISRIQTLLYRLLDDLGVGYHKEGQATAIGYFVFDCMVPKSGPMPRHLLIECQGDYWHTLQQVQSRDRSKFTYIDRYFPDHEIMYVWEHEFYAKDAVLDRLKFKLGIAIPTVDFDFSDLQLREPASQEVKSFLDAYHYIGKDRGGIAFGAYHGTKLVACAVYSPPLRQNTARQFKLTDGQVRELSRLCIHPSYHKKNFASWFISKTLKSIDTDLVVAYADRTVGHRGTVYRASNFELHHVVPADYWYVGSNGYVMHKRTLYGRAVKHSLTESAYAEQFGYIKQYGGEKLCFVYRRL